MLTRPTRNAAASIALIGPDPSTWGALPTMAGLIAARDRGRLQAWAKGRVVRDDTLGPEEGRVYQIGAPHREVHGHGEIVAAMRATTGIVDAMRGERP